MGVSTGTVNRYDGYPCPIETPTSAHIPLQNLSTFGSSNMARSLDATHKNTITTGGPHLNRAFQKYQQTMFSNTSLDGAHVRFGETSITIAGPPYEDLPRRPRRTGTREPPIRHILRKERTGVVIIVSITLLLCLALVVIVYFNKNDRNNKKSG